MNKLIYLDGSRSVGKTTLLENIKKHYPEYIVIDGYGRKEFSFFDMANNYQDFINQEKLYLSCDIIQYKLYKQFDTTVVVVKGPITDLFFALRFAQIHYPDVDLYKSELKDILLELEKCLPDKTIYLDASNDTILNRYKTSHFRVTMNEFMDNWKQYFDNKIKSLPNTVIINTEDKNAEEVYIAFMEAIKD